MRGNHQPIRLLFKKGNSARELFESTVIREMIVLLRSEGRDAPISDPGWICRQIFECHGRSRAIAAGLRTDRHSMMPMKDIDGIARARHQVTASENDSLMVSGSDTRRGVMRRRGRRIISSMVRYDESSWEPAWVVHQPLHR